MTRVLIIPAAGAGLRLGALTPKPLVPIAGRAMIDHLFALYARSVDRFVVVVGPSALEAVARHCESAGVDVGLGVQPAPTGMLDAIVAASDEVRRTRPDAVWITWCDQVAVHPATVRHLAELADATPAPALVFPTATRRDPYTHLVRDGQGRITGVLQRREGDRLPEVGESDMGLFSLSADAYFEHLGRFAREAGIGRATGERNFLPFVPWIGGRAAVRTFPCTDEVEAIGVNTPEDLSLVEAYLRRQRRDLEPLSRAPRP